MPSLQVWQGGQSDPPQSTSDSSPFWIPSEQVVAATAQAPESQKPLAQSSSVPHPAPSTQLEPQAPPQSTSVSSWF